MDSKEGETTKALSLWSILLISVKEIVKARTFPIGQLVYLNFPSCHQKLLTSNYQNYTQLLKLFRNIR